MGVSKADVEQVGGTHTPLWPRNPSLSDDFFESKCATLFNALQCRTCLIFAKAPAMRLIEIQEPSILGEIQRRALEPLHPPLLCAPPSHCIFCYLSKQEVQVKNFVPLRWILISSRIR